MNSLISIIIPCYNQGQFLDDAIRSIELDKYQSKFEVIIVNDGSSDSFTLKKFDEVSEKGILVIHQANQGLAAARNIGITLCKGDYILPLDCDNKIIPQVFLEASAILDNNEDIGVVYTDAVFFGDKTGDWIVGERDNIQLLLFNYIDACALIRKSSLIKYGMYSSDMPAMGNEDWDLWVKFYLNKVKFRYLPKVGFYYRATKTSMSFTITKPNFLNNKKYIYSKYAELISDKIFELYKKKEQLEGFREKFYLRGFISKVKYFHRSLLTRIGL